MNSIKNFIKNYWVWIGFAVILIVISIVMYRGRKKRLAAEEKIVEATDVKNQDATFPLQPYDLTGSYTPETGTAGKQVAKLQQLYNENNTQGTPLVVDGKYGPKSLAAFKGFYGNEIASNGVIMKAQYEQILKTHTQA